MLQINNVTDSNGTHSEHSQSKWIYVRWFVLRAILVVYDIIAVNAAFYLALVMRFYVAKEFHSVAGHYIEAFTKYAPVYTVCCLAVFAVFRLYSGIWRHAGLHDLNRVLGANAVCFAGHVAGTLIFGIRMPITFYCIGAVIQLCLIGASRFSYRLLLVEKEMLFRNASDAINVMVIGVGSTAQSAVKAMERDGMVRPVCVLDYKNESFGKLFDGIPVVSDVENMKSAIEKYQVKMVLLASTAMPQRIRTQILEICAQCNVETQDYTGYFQMIGNGVTLKSLAECCMGPVEIAVGESIQQFEDCEEAMRNVAGRYIVKSVAAKGSVLHIELADHDIVQNDLTEEWVKKQEKETGEEISFF